MQHWRQLLYYSCINQKPPRHHKPTPVYFGLTFFNGPVKNLLNISAITTAIMPWPNTVAGAPICSETAPVSKLPSGIMPKIAISSMPMARPRILGAASDCTRMLLTVYCAMEP